MFSPTHVTFNLHEACPSPSLPLSPVPLVSLSCCDPPHPVNYLRLDFFFPLKKNTTSLNFLGNMGYMAVKDENSPRAQGVFRGKS